MKNEITKRELYNYLKTIKVMLLDFDFDEIRNVIFYNFDSYIKFVNNKCMENKRRKNSLEDILDIIEPYIPFDFDDNALNYLISNVIDNYDPESFQKILIKRAKVDLINTIKTADTKDKWLSVIHKCQHIYKYRETNGLLYL